MELTEEHCDVSKDIDIEKSLKLNKTKRIGKNRDVWFTFKFIEMIIGIISLVYHINGALYTVEPQPHTVFFCGTFVGFLIISIFSQIRMLLGTATPPLMESIVAVTASFAYYFVAFASMYHAEKDFHLMYLTDEEEGKHQFFIICKSQSVSSLACGSVYLLHAVYAIDSCITRKDDDDCENSDEEKFSPTGAIHLHLFFRPWLEKMKFFRYLFKKIEILEAVAIWKHVLHDDDNLGPGINIYAFEEPIIKKGNILKTKIENMNEKIQENEEERAKNVDKFDQNVQVGEEDLDRFDEILMKSFKKRK